MEINITQNSFNFIEKDIILNLKHYLPSQLPLKDFVHHNTLHAFQNMNFFKGIFTASDLFGYQVTLPLNYYRKLLDNNRIHFDILEKCIKDRKPETEFQDWFNRLLNKNYDTFIEPKIGKFRSGWKNFHKIDLDNLVHPLLFRIISSYLDQGIALWNFPFEDKGLINAIFQLEEKSFSSFFKTKRVRKMLLDNNISIENLLKILVNKESLYEQYLFDQQFSHRGWSGIVSAIEDNPESLLYFKKVSLKDFIILELLLEIDALDYEFGENWKPLGDCFTPDNFNISEIIEFNEFQEVLIIWQEAFEWSYYDSVLSSMELIYQEKSNQKSKKDNTFQAIFCIDERECSIRRHLENISPECQTFGTPGFFGVEFYFHPSNGKFYEKLCPVSVKPKYLIKEKPTVLKKKNSFAHSKTSQTLFRGFASSIYLGFWTALRMVSDIFNPTMRPDISNSFTHMNFDAELIIENTDINNTENELQIGFTINEMASRVEKVLKSIGLIENFSNMIYIIAHGSSSANNPQHGAHDCGACSGRPGSVNARVFAFMANHPEVRKILNKKGILIPENTFFIAAMHDTASDEIMFYDERKFSFLHNYLHNKYKELFEKALDLNAKERSRRFSSINTKDNIKKVRKAIKKRSVSYFEPRPEFGHGTNALCFVCPREITQGLFLDRRAFLNSYDYRKDLEGELLFSVINPLPSVCGGINLEYYFSRVDNYKLGSGTKLPHNVIGLIGVANSSDGDIRPGLPLQMVEVHDPLRLLIIVEHYPEIVLKTIKTNLDLYQWFINEWIHLIVLNPKDKKFYLFKDGLFKIYEPLSKSIEKTSDMTSIFENTQKSKSTDILDTTKENIPVHIISKEV